jgi:hypothetical protein
MEAWRPVSVALASALLFLSAIPLSYRPLEPLMYWTTLKSWPGYDPLLYWFPMVLWRPGVWWTSLVVAISSIIAIPVLMRRHRFGYVLLVICWAISLALTVQYAAITRLDDRVFWFVTEGVLGGAPWEFNPRALVTCIGVAAAYTALAEALSAAVRVADKRMDLTRRCS